MMVMMMGMVCALAFAGCKKKSKAGGIGGENVGGVSGSEVTGEGLGERPGEGTTETAGQFVPVYFDFDGSQIKEGERSKIETVAAALKKSSQGGVIVEGNCDERGSAEYNLSLSERRALAVRAYLIGLGVDGSRVQTKSYGKEHPVCNEHDEGCWSKNRRAEFVLFQ
jgi:peptidoglycan-associated lipoprotein